MMQIQDCMICKFLERYQFVISCCNSRAFSANRQDFLQHRGKWKRLDSGVFVGYKTELYQKGY